MPTVSLGFCYRRPVFLECGDNDQREAAPLWLFGLFRLTVRPPPTKSGVALAEPRFPPHFKVG